MIPNLNNTTVSKGIMQGLFGNRDLMTTLLMFDNRDLMLIIQSKRYTGTRQDVSS